MAEIVEREWCGGRPRGAAPLHIASSLPRAHLPLAHAALRDTWRRPERIAASVPRESSRGIGEGRRAPGGRDVGPSERSEKGGVRAGGGEVGPSPRTGTSPSTSRRHDWCRGQAASADAWARRSARGHRSGVPPGRSRGLANAPLPPASLTTDQYRGPSSGCPRLRTARSLHARAVKPLGRCAWRALRSATPSEPTWRLLTAWLADGQGG